MIAALVIPLAPLSSVLAFTPVAAICTSTYEALDGRCMNQGYFSGTVFEGTDGRGYGGSGVFQNFGFTCPQFSLTVGSPSYCAQWNYVDSLGSDGLDQWAFPYTIDNSQPNAAQNFINFIHSYLYYTDPNCVYASNFVHPDFTFTSNDGCYGYRARIIGATFLILTMIGPPYTTYSVDSLFSSQTDRTNGPNYTYVQAGIADAKANFNLWSQEVLQEDANGQVNWDSNTPTALANSNHPNSGMRDYGHDISMFIQAPEQRHTIIFNTPTGQYIINRRCGNTMSSSPLAPPTVATATCAGYITDVAVPDPNRSFNLTVSIQFGPNSAASTAFGPDTMSTTLTGPSPYAGLSKSTTAPTISNGLASMKVAVPATNVPGTFNLTWKVTGSQTPTVTCSDTVQLAYQPYFSVSGGDVSAGQGFGVGCNPNTTADISGKNMDNGSSPANYYGAGTTHAAVATGNINQFATDTTNNAPTNLGGSTDGLSTNQPEGLAFANNIVPPPAYGGSMLDSWAGKWCVPDYVGAADPPTATFNPATLVSGTYTLSGTNIGSFTVPKGVHMTVIAPNGAYITGDIKYDTSYASLNQIPQFTLLVPSGKSIFIDRNVKEMHGFYVAEPDGSGNGGNVFTCSTAYNAEASDYATCNVSLTVYGAIAANQLIPGRTKGDVANGSTVADVPAEQFIYTPELWLGALTRPTTACSDDPTQTSCSYQQYSSLPPVL